MERAAVLDVGALTDEQLFWAIREQVNLARNSPQGHDRAKTRALAAEMKRRLWRIRPHSEVNGGGCCGPGRCK